MIKTSLPSTVQIELDSLFFIHTRLSNLFSLLFSQITLVTSGVEAGTISWIAESLQYKVFMNNTSQGLQLSVTHSQGMFSSFLVLKLS